MRYSQRVGHERRYFDGVNTLVIHVDGAERDLEGGIINVTEKQLHELLLKAGYKEVID